MDAQNLLHKALADPLYRNWGIQLGSDVANYPFVLVNALMQIGYEPLAPTPGPEFKSLFIENVQTSTFRLQSNFSYLKYVYSVDGFLGCYRGFLPYICCHSVQYLVSTCLLPINPFDQIWGAQGSGGPSTTIGRRGSMYLEQVLGIIGNVASDDDPPDPQQQEARARRPFYYGRISPESQHLELSAEIEEKVIFIQETCWRIICSNVATVCSHPFYVIGLRSVAQFVGRETEYNSIWGGVVEIIRTDGFLGFFKGLVPRLVAETKYVILTSCTIFVIKKAFNNNALDAKFSNFWLKTVAEYVANSFANAYANPYIVVANTMIVNNSGLAIGSMPHTRRFNSWTDAMDTLTETRQLSRGSSKRIYNGPFKLISSQLQPSHYFGPLHPPN